MDVDIKNIGVGNSILKYIECDYKGKPTKILNPRVIESGNNDQFTINIGVYKSDLKKFIQAKQMPILNFHFCDVLGNHYVDQIEMNRKCTEIDNDVTPQDFDFNDMYLTGNRKGYLPKYQHDNLFDVEGIR